MFTRRQVVLLVVLSLSLAILAPLNFHSSPSPADATILIINAQLADGTGAPLREGALRIRNHRIASIGKLSPAPGEQVLDAHGLVLAPGFIDIHNHSIEGLDTDPLAETQIAQGITTAIQGPDGDSPWPIKFGSSNAANIPPPSTSPSSPDTPPSVSKSWAKISNVWRRHRKSKKWPNSPGKP